MVEKLEKEFNFIRGREFPNPVKLFPSLGQASYFTPLTIDEGVGTSTSKHTNTCEFPGGHVSLYFGVGEKIPLMVSLMVLGIYRERLSSFQSLEY